MVFCRVIAVCWSVSGSPWVQLVISSGFTGNCIGHSKPGTNFFSSIICRQAALWTLSKSWSVVSTIARGSPLSKGFILPAQKDAPCVRDHASLLPPYLLLWRRLHVPSTHWPPVNLIWSPPSRDTRKTYSVSDSCGRRPNSFYSLANSVALNGICLVVICGSRSSFGNAERQGDPLGNQNPILLWDTSTYIPFQGD